MAGRKKSLNTTRLFDLAHEEIEKLYPGRTREYHPLVEMMIFAANPDLPAHVQFAANKEVTQYLIPKMKSVEHTGGDGGLQVVLLNYSDAAEQQLIPKQENEEPRLIDQSSEIIEPE